MARLSDGLPRFKGPGQRKGCGGRPVQGASKGELRLTASWGLGQRGGAEDACGTMQCPMLRCPMLRVRPTPSAHASARHACSRSSRRSPAASSARARRWRPASTRFLKTSSERRRRVPGAWAGVPAAAASESALGIPMPESTPDTRVVRRRSGACTLCCRALCSACMRRRASAFPVPWVRSLPTPAPSLCRGQGRFPALCRPSAGVPSPPPHHTHTRAHTRACPLPSPASPTPPRCSTTARAWSSPTISAPWSSGWRRWRGKGAPLALAAAGGAARLLGSG